MLQSDLDLKTLSPSQKTPKTKMEVVKNSKYKKRAEHFCFKYNMKNPKSDMKINSEKHIKSV